MKQNISRRTRYDFRHELLALLGLALSGCGDAEGPKARSLMQPVALSEHVVWLDSRNEEALLLDVGRGTPRPEIDSHELSGRPLLVQRRNEHDELLVLLTDDEEEVGRLAVLNSEGVAREYDLGTQFDAITQSSDGDYAFIHFSPTGNSLASESLLFNPNEVAVLDLNQDGEDAVVQRTLRSLGSSPQRVEFSPQMSIAGETRRLAVVFFQSEVALLDLNHLDRPEYTVELSRGSNLALSQISFSEDENKIYLLASNSNDVYVLRLLEAGGNRENDFEPSLNQLGTDATPEDMAVFESDGQRRLLVASGTSAQVVEASSSRVTQIPLQYGATRILMFEGRSPFDDEVEQRALLYSPGNTGITFLDLTEIEDRTTRNREELVVQSISSLTPLNDNRVLLTHASSSVSILDLEERTAAPIQARLTIGSAVPSLETGRIWVAPQGATTLGFIDLSNLHPGQVRLDRSISQLMVFNETEQPRVVMTHPGTAGAITILNALEPENEDDAITLFGFFEEGLLDQ